MAVDILAVCAHPDDLELSCAGLLLRARAAGARVGGVDLTRGEMGTRGTPEERAAEAAAATQLLGLDLRLNLGLPDGGLTPSREYCVKVVEALREQRPRAVLAPYWEDHHPDHVATSHLVKEAVWFAGVAKFPAAGAPHRPERVLHYLARHQVVPSLVVDVSSVMDRKRAAVACYRSQLFGGSPGAPATALSQPGFLPAWEARHRYYGSLIGVEFGEAYWLAGPVPVFDPLALFGPGAGAATG